MRVYAFFFVLVGSACAQNLLQSLSQSYSAQSAGCIVAKCHAETAPIHKSSTVKIGCVYCHGGDAQAVMADKAHAGDKEQRARGKGQRVFAEWLKFDYATVKHLNPGDLRIANETCGPCHASETLRVKKSMMATSALLWGGASYNNGILPFKNYILGESYAPSTINDPQSTPTAAKINQWPKYSDNQMKRYGVLPFLLPLPRWEVTQPPDNFRSFERGGLVSRINPSNIGIPNLQNLPGRPDNKLSDRGLGTQLLISSPVLNVHKTRLNDPHLWLPGTNDHPGDYRASGCSACHVVYANDRNLISSGPYARHGNEGQRKEQVANKEKESTGQASNNPSLQQSITPIIHQFTRAIPTSQCMVCHMHQPNGFVNTYLGFQMWDYESGNEPTKKISQRDKAGIQLRNPMYAGKDNTPLNHPSSREFRESPIDGGQGGIALSDFDKLSANPEEAVLRGKWGDPKFLREVSQLNPLLQDTQFADYHGHGWNFRAVFKKDRNGNLLDKDGRIIPENAPHKFHGLQTIFGARFCTEEAKGEERGAKGDKANAPTLQRSITPAIQQECRTAQKAVHLLDIHAERGMHCVDCHFERDVHGNGNIYGEFHNAVEIQCVDCHGDMNAIATLRTSGVPTRIVGSTRLDDIGKGKTPFGERRFLKRGEQIVQRSMLYEDVEWVIPQVLNAKNEKARRAHFTRQGVNKENEPKSQSNNPSLQDSNTPRDGFAHAPQKMDCASCHNSWITNCFGCHLPQQANWKKDSNHYEGETSRNWTSYNPQVLRDDALMLCVGPTTKGNKISPARSSSALVLSSRNADREQIYNQQAPISAAGFSSQAFNPHAPHTVRRTETRGCTDCHLSESNDNNAWLAQTLLQGTGFTNFIGKYAWVAEGEGGVEAVKVTEDGEPQAVLGSYLHRLAYEDRGSWIVDRESSKPKINDPPSTIYNLKSHHHSGNMLDVAVRGEYLYAACGSAGLRVFDIANIDNKGFSERIVTAPVSPWGQNTQVKTQNAVAVVLPTTQPIDYDLNLWLRSNYPENQEQKLHELYRYVYVVDREEGIILVDVGKLIDRDPENNFLERTPVYLSDNAPKKSASLFAPGANALAIAGANFYIAARDEILVYDLDIPTRPRLRAAVRSFKNAKDVAVQFRYAFVLDDEGLHVLDVTNPAQMRRTPNNTIKLRETYGFTLARTYAYVAAGKDGLVIIDIENPERMRVAQRFDLNNGAGNDVRELAIGAAYASVFGYVADGVNGFKVVQLTTPETPGYFGFSPVPQPRVIAWKKTHGPALAVAKGLERDRAVDESGNQISVFGRIGARPMKLDEQKKLYWKDEKAWRVGE